MLPLQTVDESVYSASKFIDAVAAIVIQTAFRRYRAILFVENMLTDEDSDVQQLGVLENSARRVQAVVPGRVPPFLLPMHQKEHADDSLNRMIIAAIRIQSVFRGFWARDCIGVDIYCARIIQKAYRGHNCRTRYNIDLFKIIIVQSVWRRNAVFNRITRSFAAAITIQSLFRGHFARRQCYTLQKMSEQSKRPKSKPKESNPKRLVQTRLRGQHVREKRSDYRLTKRDNDAKATIIQTCWRAYAAEGSYIRKLVDILIVQTVARRWLAIRMVGRKRKVQKARAVCLSRSSKERIPKRAIPAITAIKEIVIRSADRTGYVFPRTSTSRQAHTFKLTSASLQTPHSGGDYPHSVQTLAPDPQPRPVAAYPISTTLTAKRSPASNAGTDSTFANTESTEEVSSDVNARVKYLPVSAPQFEMPNFETSELYGPSSGVLSMWKGRDKKNFLPREQGSQAHQ
jgi:hypothetical protein